MLLERQELLAMVLTASTTTRSLTHLQALAKPTPVNYQLPRSNLQFGCDIDHRYDMDP